MVALSSTASEETLAASVAALLAYNEFMAATIERRRGEPTDDLVSVLIAAEVDGERLTDEQITSETLLILIGGDETTRHTSPGYRRTDPASRAVAALRADLDLLPGAVEEMLRWTSPIKNMCRTLTADNDFHGTALHAGEKIMLLFESANFDETVFGDPDVFRIDRNPNNHVTFGFGTHFCLGNQLARLELTTMTSRVLERLPDLRLVEGAELPLRPANFVSGWRPCRSSSPRPHRSTAETVAVLRFIWQRVLAFDRVGSRIPQLVQIWLVEMFFALPLAFFIGKSIDIRGAFGVPGTGEKLDGTFWGAWWSR